MSKAQPGPRHRPARDDDAAPVGAWRGRLRLWVDIKGRGSLGPGKLRLLDAISSTKSLSAAARELKMSYRLAWQHVRLIEERTGITVVERHRGGRSGGGTELTAKGRALLKAYHGLRAEVEECLQSAFRRHFASWPLAKRDKRATARSRR
jgi:molybdate transport system regulatory protein